MKAIIPNEKYALPDLSAGRMDGDMLAKANSIATPFPTARVKYILGSLTQPALTLRQSLEGCGWTGNHR
jgi:hypothetical protein